MRRINIKFLVIWLVFSSFFSICFADGTTLSRALTPSEVTQLSSSDTYALAQLKSDKSIKSISAQRVDKQAFLGTILHVNIAGIDTQFIRKSTTHFNATQFSWSGRSPNGGADFVVDGENVFGHIRVGGLTYEFRTLSPALQALVELDMSAANSAKDTITPPSAASGVGKAKSSTESESILLSTSPQALASAATTTPTVRILVAYSQHAAAALGNNLNNQINLAISQINSANQEDGVNFTAVLAGAPLQVNYSGPYDSHSTLVAFESMPDVLNAHDAYSADLMIMLESITANNDAGEAAGINVIASKAFAVVSTQYMTSNFSFAHEVGHLMGADHGIGDTTSNEFRYGHGWWVWEPQFPGATSKLGYCIHTIMSYAVQQSNSPGQTNPRLTCITDPREGTWSNITETWLVNSFSTPIGDANVANNAAVLNITAPIVTNFHNTLLAPRRVPPPSNPCATNPRACA